MKEVQNQPLAKAENRNIQLQSQVDAPVPPLMNKLQDQPVLEDRNQRPQREKPRPAGMTQGLNEDVQDQLNDRNIQNVYERIEKPPQKRLQSGLKLNTVHFLGNKGLQRNIKG